MAGYEHQERSSGLSPFAVPSVIAPRHDSIAREQDRVVHGPGVTSGLHPTAEGSAAVFSHWADAGPLSMGRASHTTWTQADTKLIQLELVRLGLYRHAADGRLGAGTLDALEEAFGGDEWRKLDAATALSRLRTAEPPTGIRGEHNLRGGEMFKDGLLDMTLGIGFDETGWDKKAFTGSEGMIGVKQVLEAHGFKEDRATATKLYMQAGRQLGKSDFGMYFVRENALTFTPPAGTPRQVHAVIRLVMNQSGADGSLAADAYRHGMTQSDVAYSIGHGRYGSGPDFDRNMSFELLDNAGEVEQQIDSYAVLEHLLAKEGGASARDAWNQFLWRVEHKRINVIGANLGNIFLNPKNNHASEFGGKLMYWNLKRKGGAGAQVATGQNGVLAQGAKDASAAHYRLLVFDGCRTNDYNASIRGTKGFDSESTDILATDRITYWNDKSAVLGAFLNGILGQQSAEQIIKGMDEQHKHADGKPMEGNGLEDNPVIR